MLGTEPQLKEEYIKSGQVRVVFSPVINHGDRSYQTHQGTECAAEQGQFWEFREVLFENQNSLWRGDIRETVKNLAAQAGLDSASFNACMDEQRYFDTVAQQDELRRQAGIRGQPMFDINGTVYAGAAPFEAFANALNPLLE